MENQINRIIGTFIYDFDQRKLELLDRILFALLLKKEMLLLKGKKIREIKRIEEILSHYCNYRNLIFKRLTKIGLSEDYLKSKIYLAPTRLVLLVTHVCQLKCRYCRVRKFNLSMEEDVLFKAIDLIFTSKSQDLQIQFFGGEPLLKFELLKKGVEYAERLNKKFKRDTTFILTTNGIALTKEKIDFLKEHNFLLECSIDGEVKRQLKIRRATDGRDYYSQMIDNLQRLFNSGIPHYSISVVIPQETSLTFNNFKYLVGLGFKRLQMNYALGVLWPEPAIKEFFQQTKKILAYIKNKKDIEFINATPTRREPVVLNAELTVDCDGAIYLESGICLEEDFFAMKKKFLVTDLNSAKDINLYFSTPFQNFYRLACIYGRYPRFRKIILNNIFLGQRYAQLIKKWMSPLP